EEVDCSTIEPAENRFVMQYRGELIPLFGVDPQSGPRTKGTQPVLVFSDRGCSMALAIDDIIDVVDEKLDIKLVDDRPCVLGYAVIQGITTEIVDIGYFLPDAGDGLARRASSAGPNRAHPAIPRQSEPRGVTA